ncbi:arsenate reductase family protein [Zoogloea sp.]|uniref:arsenate reductase (glutaredoxin) n=1 Tax=Zoogloea sp. TaxID=49181 RepID=UPI001415A724|nr:MAG: arsenate reductase (glutaredoxin) [Zoogloea sp.]
MPDTIRIYHNARCSKSRSACALLQDKGAELQIVEYLKAPPGRDELAEIVRKLGVSAESIVRKGEEVYKAEYQGRDLTEDEWLDALVRHPILIERPIAVRGGRAVIGRPPENVLSLLDEA